MDIQEFLQNRGMQEVPNPAYNSKSKKNNVSPTIQVPQLQPVLNDAVNLAIVDFNNQWSIDKKENDKYAKYGLNYSPYENMDLSLVEAQSNWKKIGNALAQTVVSELAIGIPKGFSDFVDFIGQAVGLSDPNYTNPVSEYLEKKQEEFREFAPIYSDPSKSILNGGLADIGWWASNMPSIISSLTLLVPSMAITKVGKLAQLGKFVSYGKRYLPSVKKAIAKQRQADNLRALGKTAEEIEKAGKLNAWENILTSQKITNATNVALETTTTAALSRTMENYQEARQTYNDVYLQAKEYFNNISDEEYAKVKERNKNLIADNGVDPDNKDAVAKLIAKAGADETFRLDFLNLGWDVVQLYALRGLFNGKGISPSKSAAVRRADKEAIQNAGKTAEQIAEIKAKRKFTDKTKDWLEDRAYGSKLVVGSELSEGAEEALNYVAQQEGMHLGNVLTGQLTEEHDTNFWGNVLSGFDGRLADYVKAPALWDSAFWGVMGGVVFQTAGSKLKQVSQRLTEQDGLTKEERAKLPWYHLEQLTENKARITEIQGRPITTNEYIAKLKKINDNIDPARSTKIKQVNFESEAEREAARQQIRDEFETQIAFNAMQVGQMESLKAYFANDNVRKAMVQNGFFDEVNENNEKIQKTDAELETESKQYVDGVLKRFDQIENAYNRELVILNDIVSSINILAKRKDRIPIEYVQIMADRNVRRKLKRQVVDRSINNIQEQAIAIHNELVDNNTIDANIDYENMVNIKGFSDELGKLRLEMKEILSKPDLTLSDRISLNNIKRQIDFFQDRLKREKGTVALNFAVYRSLQFIRKIDDGRYELGDTPESQAFKAEIIDNRIVNGIGNHVNFENILPMSYLGNFEVLSDALVGEFDTFESDVVNSVEDLRNISKTLYNLYEAKIGSQIQRDKLESEITNDKESVQQYASYLHNTMNEARKKAIQDSYTSIRNIYKNKKDATIQALDNLKQNKSIDNIQDLTDKEKSDIKSAVDALAITDRKNGDIIEEIFEALHNQDKIEHMIAQNNPNNQQNNNQQNNNQNNQQQPQTSLQPSPQPTPTPQPTQIQQSPTPQQPISQPQNPQPTNPLPQSQNSQNQAPISQNQQPTNQIDPQSIENRLPDYAQTPKAINGVSDDITSNEQVNFYDNGDGTFTIDTSNLDKAYKENALYDNADSVDLLSGTPFIEFYPIVKRNPNGSYDVISKGRVGININQQGQTSQTGQTQTQQSNSTPQQPNSQQPTPIPETTSQQSNEDYINTTKTTLDGIINTYRNGVHNTSKAKQDTQNYIADSLMILKGKLVENGMTSSEANDVVTNLAREYDEKVKQIDTTPIDSSTGEVIKPSGDEVRLAHANEVTQLKRKIGSELVSETMQMIKDDNITLDIINDYINSKATEYENEFVSQGLDRTVAQQTINDQLKLVKKFAENYKKKNNNLHSSITEVRVRQMALEGANSSNETSAVVAYRQAMYDMVNNYCKELGLEKHNGKHYINLEDLLRYVNTITNDSTMANIMFDSLKKHLLSNEAKEEYVVVDKEELNNSNFLNNVAKSAEERLKEKQERARQQTIDLNRVLDESKDKEETYQAIESLKPGDKLGVQVNRDKKVVYFTNVSGVKVGSAPIPFINNKTGAYNITNNGWIYDILPTSNGQINSRLYDFFLHVFRRTNDSSKELLDLVLEYTFSNPSNERKKEIIEAFNNNAEIQNARKTFINTNAKNKELIEHFGELANFMIYTDGVKSFNGGDDIYIRGSLQEWFRKLSNSYDLAYSLANGATNLNISVQGVLLGDIIRVEDKVDLNHIDKLSTPDKAFAGGINYDDNKIAITDPNNPNSLLISGKQNQSFNVSQGRTFVTLTSPTGATEFIQAYPVLVTDNKLGKEAKEIVQAVKEEALKLFKAYNDQPTTENRNAIQNFFNTLITNYNGNSSLFGNVYTKPLQNGKGFMINYYGKGNVIIVYNDQNQPNNVKVGIGDKNVKINSKEFEDKLNNILDNLKFRFSYPYFTSDSNNNINIQGFVKRKNGKFVVTIGDKSWEFNSFNEFVLGQNLVRLNTKPNENGTSNFNRNFDRTNKDKQDKVKQTFRINITSSLSSPVEESKQTTPTQITQSTQVDVSTKVTEILNSDNKDKGNAIFESALGTDKVFTEKTLNALKNLELLPKNIIFDPEFNSREGFEDKNAAYSPSKKQVIVGQKWLDMFNNPITREEAIRKLIHEQIHHKIREARKSGSNTVKSIESIYNEFKEALNNTEVQDKLKAKGLSIDQLKRYLFEGNEAALEEFLVESLTSRELADALNTIDAKDYKRGRIRNLFQKLLKALADLFGWNVREGSLYEKELYTIRTSFSENKKETKEKKDNKDNNQPSLFTDEETKGEGVVNQQPEVKPEEKPVVVEQPKDEDKEKQFSQPKRRDRNRAKSKLSSITEQTKISDKLIKNNKIKIRHIGNGRIDINNNKSLFGRVSLDVEYKDKEISTVLLTPTKFLLQQDINFNRINNSIKDNYYDMVYNLLLAAKANNINHLTTNSKIKHNNTINDINAIKHFFGEDIYNKYYMLEEYKDNDKKAVMYYYVIDVNKMLNAIKEKFNIENNIEFYKVFNDLFKGKYNIEEQEENKRKIFNASAFNKNKEANVEESTEKFNKTLSNRGIEEDLPFSSITEIARNVPSVAEFTNRLPISQQAKFARLVQNGEVSTSCR